MGTLTAKTRSILVALYLALIVEAHVAFYVIVLHMNGRMPGSFGGGVIYAHALPLLIGRFVQDLVYGGPVGAGRAVLVACAVVLWWPLPVVAAVPRLWASRVWKRALVAYFAVLAVLALASAVWLAVDPGLLAG